MVSTLPFTIPECMAYVNTYNSHVFWNHTWLSAQWSLESFISKLCMSELAVSGSFGSINPPQELA